MAERIKSILDRFVTGVVSSTRPENLAPRVVRRISELAGVDAVGLMVDIDGNPRTWSAGDAADQYFWDEDGESPRHSTLGDVMRDVSRRDVRTFRGGQWSRARSTTERVVAIEVTDPSGEPLAICILFGKGEFADESLAVATLMTDICSRWCAINGSSVSKNRTWDSAPYLSISEMSGEVFHSINGSLAVIGMTTELALGLPEVRAGEEEMRQIREAAARVGRSVKLLDAVLSEWPRDTGTADVVTAVCSAVDSLRREAASAGFDLEVEDKMGTGTHVVGVGGAALGWAVRELLLQVLSTFTVVAGHGDMRKLVVIRLTENSGGDVSLIILWPGLEGLRQANSNWSALSGSSRWSASRAVIEALGCSLRVGVDDLTEGLTAGLPR
jgi:hypothetical protein